MAGYTAEGVVNHLPSNISDVKKIYVLQHASEVLLTSVLRQIRLHFIKKHNLEVLYSALGRDYLDGLIIRSIDVAIVVERVVENMDQTGMEVIRLANVAPSTNITADEKTQQHIQQHVTDAFRFFKKGLSIHDDLEQLYIQQMDFKKANDIGKELIQQIFVQSKHYQKQSLIRQRLFGTNTPDGAVNVVEQLIQPISTVYYIKGRAGTGKSTLMRQIISAAEARGIDLELYHCSFDPGSIDMVIIRELDVCLFDSTAPHAFFPSRSGEMIIDMYEKTVKPGTDERYATEIADISTAYKQEMKNGITALQRANQYRSKWEGQFTWMEETVVEICTHIVQRFTP